MDGEVAGDDVATARGLGDEVDEEGLTEVCRNCGGGEGELVSPPTVRIPPCPRPLRVAPMEKLTPLVPCGGASHLSSSFKADSVVHIYG